MMCGSEGTEALARGPTSALPSWRIVMGGQVAQTSHVCPVLYRGSYLGTQRGIDQMCASGADSSMREGMESTRPLGWAALWQPARLH